MKGGLVAAGILDLEGYMPYHVARADMLAREGRGAEAIGSYRKAVSLTGNDAERSFLAGKIVGRIARDPHPAG